MNEEEKTVRILPTKDEWEQMNATLSGVYGAVTLEIDGFKVDYQRRLIGANSLGTMTYVNEQFLGKWMGCDGATPKHEEARRFLKLKEKSLYPPKKRAELIKKVGKRDAKKFFDVDSKVYICDPVWTSFAALKKHLLANNHNIRICNSNSGLGADDGN